MRDYDATGVGSVQYKLHRDSGGNPGERPGRYGTVRTSDRTSNKSIEQGLAKRPPLNGAASHGSRVHGGRSQTSRSELADSGRMVNIAVLGRPICHSNSLIGFASINSQHLLTGPKCSGHPLAGAHKLTPPSPPGIAGKSCRIPLRRPE